MLSASYLSQRKTEILWFWFNLRGENNRRTSEITDVSSCPLSFASQRSECPTEKHKHLFDTIGAWLKIWMSDAMENDMLSDIM